MSGRRRRNSSVLHGTRRAVKRRPAARSGPKSRRGRGVHRSRATGELRRILRFQERSGALLARVRLSNASEPAFVFRP